MMRRFSKNEVSKNKNKKNYEIKMKMMEEENTRLIPCHAMPYHTIYLTAIRSQV